jgi:hypothetical protein
MKAAEGLPETAFLSAILPGLHNILTDNRFYAMLFGRFKNFTAPNILP